MAKSKQTIPEDKYLKKRKELIDLINIIHQQNFEKIYYKVIELFMLEKFNNSDFTKRALARELNMSEATIYRMMDYFESPAEIKEKVKQNEISMVKAARILHLIRKNTSLDYKIKIFNEIIKNNMTEDEIDRFVRRDGLITLRMNEVRDYKNTFNIYRDLVVGSLKMTRTLKSVKLLPQTQVINTMNMLIELRSSIDNAIKKLKKMGGIKNGK